MYTFISHLYFFPCFSRFKHERSLAVFIIRACICRAVFRAVVDVKGALAQTPPTHHANGDGSAILHTLSVSALEGNATAGGQILFFYTLIDARCRHTSSMICRVFLQYITCANHHTCGLDAVESATLLLVKEGVVVSQLNQLIQFLFRILLLQILQDADHLREKESSGLFAILCLNKHLWLNKHL